jgi:hypothetical protein
VEEEKVHLVNISRNSELQNKISKWVRIIDATKSRTECPRGYRGHKIHEIKYQELKTFTGREDR